MSSDISSMTLMEMHKFDFFDFFLKQYLSVISVLHCFNSVQRW